MRALRTLAASAATALALAAFPMGSAAQERPATPPGTAPGAPITPGPSYDANGLVRALLGDGWRDVWLTPVRAPLFNIDTFAGGLRVDKRGGGFQSVTLHLTEQNGWREYRFRSVDKFPIEQMPPALKGTLVGKIIADQTSSLFPAAGLMVPPFIKAIGGLHVVPELYVMPDHPRLGEHRARFAGMLGTVELKGEEAPDDKPGFAGSSKIKGTDNFFEDLASSRAHRIDEREFLSARLIDFLINDTDRTPDNLDWARFATGGDTLWRPVLRDRDRAFTNAHGFINKWIVQRIYPKMSEFAPTYSLEGLMVSSYVFDRRLLQRLTARDFEDVARRVQAAVTDAVIEESIAELPPEWRATDWLPTRLRSTLKARRALLPEVAMQFYRELAAEPDIHLTDDGERIDITRDANGQVTVTVPGISGGSTYYQRTFLPSETKEIRVYLGKGNDRAVVRGASSDDIKVRVIGEGGDDVLADSAGGGATRFYDSEGRNQFSSIDGTNVSERSWDAPAPTFGFSVGHPWKPDWGGSSGWGGVVKYSEGAGVVLGVGPRFVDYGFRRLPYRWKAGANLLVGTGNGRLGFTTDLDYRKENSPLAFTVKGRASQLEAFRFYGFGNDSPEVDRTLTLVEQTVVSVEPAVVWRVGWRQREQDANMLQRTDSSGARRPVAGELHAGPVVSWNDPDPKMGSPFAALAGATSNSFTLAGVRAGFELDGTDRGPVPTSGWALRGNVAAYPALLDLDDDFTTASGSAAAYLPLAGTGASVALRIGGAVASGVFPPQYAATLGGWTSLRGYRSRRFAGDAAANGSAELRLPIGPVNLGLIRPEVGIFGLTDVGRVWLDGVSAGDWHAGVGGGLWFSALGKAVTISYAHGQQHRFYLKTGLAF